MKEPDDGEVRSGLRSEVAGWDPRLGPDLRVLLHRSHRPWRGPIARSAAVAALIIGLLFVLAVAVVLIGPALAGTDDLRARLTSP